MGKAEFKTSYSGFTIRIRVTSTVLDPEFLTYYLKSASTHELLIGAGEGANISNLNQKILTSLPIAYPNSELQKSLMANIKQIDLETNSLIEIYRQKLNNIDELKKSILQKAFTGELSKSNA
jgi:type I restriction enzyme S subunit